MAQDKNDNFYNVKCLFYRKVFDKCSSLKLSNLSLVVIDHIVLIRLETW